MSNRYLKPLYLEIFNQDFDYGEFDDRLKMQKVIYMLQELGAPIGSYGFRWYKHGPFSQELLDDMYMASNTGIQSVSFSSDVQNKIQQIRYIVNCRDKDVYEIGHWLECVASILYLRKYILSRSEGKDSVLSELVKRKSHLSNNSQNSIAYDLVTQFFRV